MDCKKIKPVNPKGNQPLIFIGRTVAKAESPILWPPGMKGQLIGKDPDAEKVEGRMRRGRQRMRRLVSLTDSKNMNLSKLREMMDRGVWLATFHEVTRSQTRLKN